MTNPPGVDPPRALDLQHGGFNFTVGLEQRIRAYAGAPAFAERQRRLDTHLRRFWEAVDQRAREIDIAAREGRIADTGQEWAPVLRDDDGRDPIAARAHARELYRARKDREEDTRLAWNRGWQRHVEKIDWSPLAEEVEAYNRWFPVEANLPMEPETGRYLHMGLPWVPARAPTAADVLARHPLR
jgi:hypothetical protein